MRRLVRWIRWTVGGLLFAYALYQLVGAIRGWRPSIDAYATDTGELVPGIRIVPLSPAEASIARTVERDAGAIDWTQRRAATAGQP